MTSDQHLLLYDGSCGLCNSSVKWVATHDVEHTIRKIPQDSDEGRTLISAHQLEDVDSIVYIKNGKVWVYSQAVVELMRTLEIYPSLRGLLSIIPLGIRDWGYRLIARYRRHFFKNDVCEL